MAIDPPFTVWQDLPVGPPSDAIRLVAADVGLQLYRRTTSAITVDPVKAWPRTCEVHLSSEALTGSPAPEVTVPQNYASGVAYDIAATGDGQVAVALERFNGGDNALVVGTAQGGELKIKTTYDDFNDYRFPRFVRSAVAPGEQVTAIANRALIVLMSGTPAPRQASSLTKPPYRVLARGTAGLVLATGGPLPSNTGIQADGLLPIAPRLTLLGKTQGPPGPVSPSGDTPGTLFVQPVSRGGSSPLSRPLLDRDGTYAFDADAQTETVLVLASALKGPQLLALDLTSGATKPIAWPPGYPPTGLWIASPTVCAIPGDPGTLVSFAFYEGSDREVTGIRYGQIDLSKLP